MSAFDWLLENEYPLLLLLFVQAMVPYGYGDVREVPVVSIFQFRGLFKNEGLSDF
jgi:hypothetical protein